MVFMWFFYALMRQPMIFENFLTTFCKLFNQQLLKKYTAKLNLTLPQIPRIVRLLMFPLMDLVAKDMKIHKDLWRTRVCYERK